MREFLGGAVDIHILHHAAGGDIHGAWMSRELAGHGYEISPGTLYPTLHRLEKGGLLTSRKVVEGGHARRDYAITADGREALERMRNALRELADEMLSG
jgi:DNA-binding PadR family transcriptional regulator